MVDQKPSHPILTRVDDFLAADTLFINYELSERENLRVKVARIPSPADIVLFHSQKYFESSTVSFFGYIYKISFQRSISGTGSAGLALGING